MRSEVALKVCKKEFTRFVKSLKKNVDKNYQELYSMENWKVEDVSVLYTNIVQINFGAALTMLEEDTERLKNSKELKAILEAKKKMTVLSLIDTYEDQIENLKKLVV